MKFRRVAGGLIVVGILIGLMLDWRLPGLGVNDDSQPEQQTTPAEEPAHLDNVRSDTSGESSLISYSKRPVDVLEVVIDDRNYAVREATTGESTEKPAELAEIVRLAGLTRGNEDGTRVRIIRRPSSRVTAELLLKDSLIESGLKEGEIQMLYAPSNGNAERETE